MDIRVLESQSLRSMFVWLLVLVFLLGADVALIAYQIFHQHRLNWSEGANMIIVGFMGFRYSRLIYRKLGR